MEKGKFSGAKKLLGPIARTVGYEAAWYLPAPARMAVEVAESVAVQQSVTQNMQAATQGAVAPVASGAAAVSTPMATPVPVASTGNAPTYYFDGNGAWLAYREGDHLFDAATNAWLGWSPKHDDDFAATDGSYLCSAWHAWLVRPDAPIWEGSAGQIAPLSPAPPVAPTAAVPPPSPAPAGFSWFQRRLS